MTELLGLTTALIVCNDMSVMTVLNTHDLFYSVLPPPSTNTPTVKGSSSTVLPPPGDFDDATCSSRMPLAGRPHCVNNKFVRV